MMFCKSEQKPPNKACIGRVGGLTFIDAKMQGDVWALSESKRQVAGILLETYFSISRVFVLRPSLQAKERQRTGISSLKVGYNRVFGYYIEITKANLGQVPDDYIR